MKLNFTEKEYNSDYGMITYIWGPLLWHYLHIMSFNYPVNPVEYNKENGYSKGFIQNCYYLFITLLGYILPCGACRKNLKDNLESLDFKKRKSEILKNRKNFSKFIYDLHETVNKMLDKKSNLNYEEIRDFYEHFRAFCSKDKKHNGCTVLQHNNKEREKPKVVVYFVPFGKKIKTTKVHKKCNIKCVHESD
tara:strand:- start:1673 stop:2248 length:576 start_codon:yes stop_codon:yes gene_type:complete